MNGQLLTKLFGTSGKWSGACTIILNADANVQTLSNDSIIQGGLKSFAPRLITGRVVADTVRLLPEDTALLAVQKTVIRQQTGDDLVRHTLVVIDTEHVAAIEFPDLASLKQLEIAPPN